MEQTIYEGELPVNEMIRSAIEAERKHMLHIQATWSERLFLPTNLGFIRVVI